MICCDNQACGRESSGGPETKRCPVCKRLTVHWEPDQQDIRAACSFIQTQWTDDENNHRQEYYCVRPVELPRHITHHTKPQKAAE